MPRFTAISLAALTGCFGLAGAPPSFREVTVTTGLKMGYQLVVADLNVDGKPDIIVIDERSTELAWFENPSWERHVLAAEVPRSINLEVCDWDRDGKPEIAMAHHFETNPEKSVGTVLLLKSGADVRQPWVKQEIDRIPTAHRLRWIDPRGDGQRLLLVAPLVGLKARAPEYADQAPVYWYKPGEWKRTLLTDEPKGILHSIAPVAWDKRGEQLFTACFSGIHLWRPGPGGAWRGEEIAKGDPRACPECGSSEIKTGKLGKRRFIAAIEPWHGNQVVVYSPKGKSWQRNVIETGMVNGHALAVGDLDGDGRDEIVAGFRGKGTRLFLFSASDAAGAKWERHVLDDGKMAAADCKIADFNGDNRPDIACSGASTGNVKIYENLGRARAH
jgi:hypothetical protein